jgi:hypothetical protein
VARGAKVNDFDLWGLKGLEEDVLGFEIAVDEARVFEDGHGVEELRHKDLDELRRQALELVLLNELVEIGAEQLKDETEM